MNKIFGMLNTVKNDSFKSSIEQVEELLKSWGATFGSKEKVEDAGPLKREILELRKNLKELKLSYITNVPNPSEDDLRQQVVPD